jgi:hypothetical protein
MSDQTLTPSDFPDDVLDTEEYVLGDDAAATLKELWGLGELDLDDVDEEMNEIFAERENDEIYARAYLSLDASMLDLSDTDPSIELPDWLSELDQATQSSAPDLDF